MITTINATAANECSISANRITGIEKAGAKYGRQMITPLTSSSTRKIIAAQNTHFWPKL
ncbi:hypothetical protein UUU_43410 [Klebsiella pneumoniae subsp. pneumoniae DSM 30104 = JCM 1662 = NBRC 14940]|nr:hypothetical protein UUU_43410 [Klebsiella pneumoniae subsp. pneumoniae DSM 30104 = JCM 1662 = NBRC 14940]